MNTDQISGPSSYASMHGIIGFPLLKFRVKLFFFNLLTYSRLFWALYTKEVFIGPFKGEFGNFLGHTLPFLMYLHKHKVKIHFCGFEILEPYMVDENGKSIIQSFYKIRDIYQEAPPSMNSGYVPKDVQGDIDEFRNRAHKKFTYFDLEDSFFYFFIYRIFVASGHAHMYDISGVYQDKKENACALFPRNKGASVSLNNGEQWNYQEVIDELKKVFEKVYVVGHPAHVFEIKEQEGVELVITSDNSLILKACSNSQFIFSPHSGVVYLAPLLRKKFVMLYKGGSIVKDIGSIKNTQLYLKSISGNGFIDYCFSLQQLTTYLKNVKTPDIREKIRN
jgi:hypothetical protein